MDFLWENVKRFGYLFYIMDPREHVYEKIDDVKDYFKEVTPLLFVTVLTEQLIRYYQKKPLWRLNDVMSNISHGILMELSKIPFKGAEVFVYAYIYKNYRIFELPWESPWTWILCWFLTDFGYYWMHRLVHQINILWAIHETHHAPEDMHLTSPLRNHIFLLPINWLTYLPMAFAIPPSIYLVHYQISILYQFWLHSEIQRNNFLKMELQSQNTDSEMYDLRKTQELDTPYLTDYEAWEGKLLVQSFYDRICVYTKFHPNPCGSDYKIIYKLPAPVEKILYTPSHHRAHHGRNRRYIDVNFGGFLIIWDRLFGTYEEETLDEKPVYGVTTQMNSFNPLYTETRHFIHIWKKFWEYDTIGNKLSVIFKGPGWSPGKPWTGYREDIPHPVPEIPKYDPQYPFWWKTYTMVQFVIFFTAYLYFALNMALLSKMTIAIIASFLAYSCITFGFLLDNSRYAPPTEYLRCILYFLVDKLVFHEVTRFSTDILIHMYIYRTIFAISAVIWTIFHIYENVKIAIKQKHL